MQLTETLNEGLKRGFTITVTAAELDAKVNEKIAEAQPEVEMKGFRKGKVPFAMLKRQFGPKMMGDAMQETIDTAMKGHFDESGDRPATEPSVKMENEDWKEGDDLTVSMSYEKLPEIPEADLASVSLERLVVKAEDAAVDEALQNIAKSAQDFEDKPAKAKAEDGDQVVIDFVGKVDGEPFEGGMGEDHPLVLGSNAFIPGFEEQLVGAKAGDDKTVTVTFPAEYGAEHLKGKEATFDCKVKAVKKPVPAPIDDALAKRYGAEDLEALKTQIRERLEAEYAQAARAVLKRKLLDALDAMVKFDLPPSLTKAEANQIAHQLWHDENPDVHGHDHPEIEPTEEHIRLAERRVRLGLLLAEIGNKAEVKVTDAEMTQAVMTQARQYPGQERQFFEFIQKNQQMLQQLRAPIFEDKVIDHIVEQANVTEKEVTKEELEKAIEALDEEI